MRHQSRIRDLLKTQITNLAIWGTGSVPVNSANQKFPHKITIIRICIKAAFMIVLKAYML